MTVEMSSEQVEPLLELWRTRLSEPVRWCMKYGVESGWLQQLAQRPRVAHAVAQALRASPVLRERKWAAHLAGELRDLPLLQALVADCEKNPGVEAQSVIESVVQALGWLLECDRADGQARGLLRAIADGPVKWNSARAARGALEGKGIRTVRVSWERALEEIKPSPEELAAFEAWDALAARLEQA